MVRAEQTQDTLERLEESIGDLWTEARDNIESNSDTMTLFQAQHETNSYAESAISLVRKTVEDTELIFSTGADTIRFYLKSDAFANMLRNEFATLVREYKWDSDGRLVKDT